MSLYIIEISDGINNEAMLIEAPNLLVAEATGKRSSDLDYATISTAIYTDKRAKELGLTHHNEIPPEERTLPEHVEQILSIKNGDLVQVKKHEHDTWSKFPYRYIGLDCAIDSDRFVVKSTRTDLFYSYNYCRRAK